MNEFDLDPHYDDKAGEDRMSAEVLAAIQTKLHQGYELTPKEAQILGAYPDLFDDPTETGEHNNAA